MILTNAKIYNVFIYHLLGIDCLNLKKNHYIEDSRQDGRRVGGHAHPLPQKIII